ncbi:hypothetical protein M0R19_07505 [Candidatus Pacearchaeota archaeon]|nr:hypothetical protein [Candidatus Pacearchaeota archaeon]
MSNKILPTDEFKLDLEPMTDTKEDVKENTVETVPIGEDKEIEKDGSPITVSLETTKVNLLSFEKPTDKTGIFSIPETSWIILHDKSKPELRPKIYNYKKMFVVGLETDCYLSHSLKKKEVYYKYKIDEDKFILLRLASKKGFTCEIISVEKKILTNYARISDSDPIDKVRNIKVKLGNMLSKIESMSSTTNLNEDAKATLNMKYKMNNLCTVLDALKFVGKKSNSVWHPDYLRKLLDVSSVVFTHHFN